MSQIGESLQIEDLHAYEQWWVITMKVNKQNKFQLSYPSLPKHLPISQSLPIIAKFIKLCPPLLK
jgi:hypothetical protein